MNKTIVHNFDEIIEWRGTNNRKWNTYPKDVIPMWIAETDFKCPQPVVDVILKKAEEANYSYYLTSEKFADAIQGWMRRRHQWEIDSEWVGFSPGIISGVQTALEVYTNPGDNVIIQTPAYHAFHTIIKNCGRVKITNPMILENGYYAIDFDDLEMKIKRFNVRAIILCNPHNPIAMAYSREDLQRIGDLCLLYNVKVISDEAHCDLVYKGKKHIPFSSLNPDIAQISMTFINPSKSFNIGGTKTAAAIIPNEQIRNCYKQLLIKNQRDIRNIFGQFALEKAYSECDYYVDQLVTYIEKNAAYTLEYFNSNLKDLNLIPPNATYLIWIDFNKLNMDQEHLNRFLLNKAKLALSDGISFGVEGKGYMRMNIACRRALLEEALERLKNAID
jgi:cystathionine beta-lyase